MLYDSTRTTIKRDPRLVRCRDLYKAHTKTKQSKVKTNNCYIILDELHRNYSHKTGRASMTRETWNFAKWSKSELRKAGNKKTQLTFNTN